MSEINYSASCWTLTDALKRCKELEKKSKALQDKADWLEINYRDDLARAIAQHDTVVKQLEKQNYALLEALSNVNAMKPVQIIINGKEEGEA